MVRILVTNDDGIDSVGLHVLARALTDLGDVVVIAPDREYSGACAAVGALHVELAEARGRQAEPAARAVHSRQLERECRRRLHKVLRQSTRSVDRHREHDSGEPSKRDPCGARHPVQQHEADHAVGGEQAT